MNTASVPIKMTTSTVKLPRDVWLVFPQNSSGTTPNTTEQCCNVSLDSGVAGLRDTPYLCNHSHGNNNNNNDIDLPEYIVDPTTKTTYLKGKFLGKGGFARVHELTDLTTNKSYAGKIIPKSRITKPHHKEKIAREIDVHRHLVHKNVVRFHHCFEDDENVYIILEYCSRKSLVHVLKHRRTLTEPEVRYYLRQLALGVEYIHSQKVIHRDLKLGNMFITEDMVMKIGDFGLATRVENDKKVTICGTPNYIAPEVLNKLSYSYEADVWAMGCIMYAMLVGQPPFETSTLKETYARIVMNKYVIPPLVSKSARSLIRLLLQPNPKERPQIEHILKHEFFSSGFLPDTLAPSCTTHIPKFPTNSAFARPQSQIIEYVPTLTQDIKKITASVSTIKLSSPKSSRDVSKTSKEKLSRSHSLKEKKDSVGLQNAIKQKLTSVLCPERNSKKKTSCTAADLRNIVSSCLENMPTTDGSGYANTCSNTSATTSNNLFISKWIDYSNKYGFGFQLSNRAVGVLFNDSTRISYSADRSRVEFHDIHGKMTCYQSQSVPMPLQERYTLLRYFSQYMDENLTDGGDVKTPVVGGGSTKSGVKNDKILYMKRWVRTPAAIIMQLSNGNLQINFFKDHTKVILSLEKGDYYLTYINSERQSVSYQLSRLGQMGCDACIRERLLFALTVLQEFAELDGDEM